MRKIVVGKLAGFCGGINLCVNTLNKKLDEYNSLYCLGDVVHNKDVVNDFKNKGLIVVESIEDVPDGSRCVLRAHGAEKKIYDRAKEKKLELIDLTCPKVIKVRELVKDFVNKDNYLILFFGEKNHPETKSTYSFCGDNSFIIEDNNDIENAIKICGDFDNIIVISQTTFNEKLFNEYLDIVKSRVNKKFKIFNTICNATHTRQEEVFNMSKELDSMIIIGGKKSSNTRKLYDISLENNKNTIFIENVKDLDINSIKDFNNIGIMAGASTPKYIIDEVVEYISD